MLCEQAGSQGSQEQGYGSPVPAGCSPSLPAAAVLDLAPPALGPAVASAPAAAAPGWKSREQGWVETLCRQLTMDWHFATCFACIMSFNHPHAVGTVISRHFTIRKLKSREVKSLPYSGFHNEKTSEQDSNPGGYSSENWALNHCATLLR